MSSLYYDEIEQRLRLTNIVTATTPRTASPSNFPAKPILGKRSSPHLDTSATLSCPQTLESRKRKGVLTYFNAGNTEESRMNHGVSPLGVKQVTDGVCCHANGSVSNQHRTATTSGTSFYAPENQSGNTTDGSTQVSCPELSSTYSR